MNEHKQQSATSDHKDSSNPQETILEGQSAETHLRPPNLGEEPNTDEKTFVGAGDSTPEATLIGPTDGGTETVIGQADPTATIIGESPEARDETVDFAPSYAGTVIHGSQVQEIATSKAGSKRAIGGRIGDYRIDAELGRGGMGVVYKAHHTKLRRDVALKMILSGQHASTDALERFMIEARAVAHLQHPNIVQIFDIGEHEGLPYFSLEFVKGSALDSQIRGEPQTPEHSAQLVETLARAMQFAHDNNVLHRDIKPANVLIAEDGTPKVADFGLAKQVKSDDSGQTQAGTIMGSPSYMSPEQASGRTSEIGPASDQYSLGAMLYEMLTARPPFKAPKPLQTVMQVISQEPVPPRQLLDTIPLDLETICLKSLQKDQTKRYESCEALADDLRRFLDGKPIEARAVSNLERAWRWCKRNPHIAVPSTVAVVALCATAAISTGAYFKVSEQADTLQHQAEVIKQERDNANAAKIIAVDARKLAEQRENEARSQADLALDSIQSVVVNVDGELQNLPQLNQVRKKLLRSLVKDFDKLEVGLTKNGVAGTGIPTLMSMKMSLANSLFDEGETDKAGEIYKSLHEMAEKRFTVKGRNDASRTNMAKILMQLAVAEHTQYRNIEKALQLNTEALELVEDTIANPRREEGGPPRGDILFLVGGIQQNIGVIHLTNGNLPSAATHFEAALKANGEVLRMIRSEPGFEDLNNGQKDQKTHQKQSQYDKAALGLAYIVLRLGQTEKSLPLYKKALAGRREIANRYPLKDKPEMVSLHQAVAGYCGNFGNSLMWLDRLDEAEPLIEESVATAKATFAITRTRGTAKSALAVAYYRRGTLRDEQKKADESKSDFEESLRLRRELFRKSKSDKDRVYLMLSLARCGEIAEARQIARELGETDKQDGELHLERARCYAQLSRRAEDDSQRDNDIQQGLKALTRAVEEGYGDPFRVSVEHDLRPLRGQDEFDQLIGRLQASAAQADQDASAE